MAESKSNGCLKAFLVTALINVLVLGVLGGGLYYLWKTKGEPTLAQMQAQIEEGNLDFGSGEGGDQAAGSTSNRPVVASAPMMAGPDTYQRFVNRHDVLTLVNYYSDT